jgi:hypothetical protein
MNLHSFAIFCREHRGFSSVTGAAEVGRQLQPGSQVAGPVPTFDKIPRGPAGEQD